VAEEPNHACGIVALKFPNIMSQIQQAS